MFAQQQKLQLSTYSDLYDIILLKDNPLLKINGLINFSLIYEELVTKYCSFIIKIESVISSGSVE